MRKHPSISVVIVYLVEGPGVQCGIGTPPGWIALPDGVVEPIPKLLSVGSFEESNLFGVESVGSAGRQEPMTVHKREDGRGWYVHFVLTHLDGSKERVRKRSPVQTRRGAEEYERQLRTELSKPERKELKRIRLKDFAHEFLEIHVATKKKYSTQVTYESTIRVHLVPNLGDMWLHEISAKTIEKLQAKVGVDRSSKTVRNTIGVLSKMLHVAQTWGHILELPQIEFGKVVEPSFRFLDDRERRALLEATGKYWYGPIFAALQAGFRMGELWALEREQLFLDKAKIRIDRAVWRGVVGLPKHDKIRTVDIPPSLIAFLRNHLKVVPMSSRLVFPKVGGGMIQERKADTGLRRACVRAEVDPIGWHVLLH